MGSDYLIGCYFRMETWIWARALNTDSCPACTSSCQLDTLSELRIEGKHNILIHMIIVLVGLVQGFGQLWVFDVKLSICTHYRRVFRDSFKLERCS